MSVGFLSFACKIKSRGLKIGRGWKGIRIKYLHSEWETSGFWSGCNRWLHWNAFEWVDLDDYESESENYETKNSLWYDSWRRDFAAFTFYRIRIRPSTNIMISHGPWQTKKVGGKGLISLISLIALLFTFFHWFLHLWFTDCETSQTIQKQLEIYCVWILVVSRLWLRFKGRFFCKEIKAVMTIKICWLWAMVMIATQYVNKVV